MSTGWANRARPEKVPATAVTPLTSPVAPHIHGCAIGSEHDVWVEKREQRVEVAAARGGEERVDDFSLPGEIGVGNWDRSLHPAAGAAGERTMLA